MGQPITWQTVRAGSDLAEAGRPLLASQVSFNGAFDAFNRILKERQNIDASNVQVGQEVGKQAYLDQLAQAKTPEELAALQASGALDTQRQALGAQARAALRGADEARLTGLRQQQVAGQAYGDGQQDRASMDIRNSIAELTNAGRFSEARESLDSSTEIRDKAPLLAAITAAERGRVIQGREDTTYGRTVKMGDISVKTAEMGLTKAEQDAADATEQRALETTVSTLRQRQTENQAEVSAQQGTLAKQLQLPTTAQGLPDFAKMDAKQRILFDEEAQVLGLPGVVAGLSGDTARGDALYRELTASGKFSPRVLQANEGSIRGSASTLPPALVGNDAASAALATAKNEVAFDRIDASNWYAPNSQDARKSYEELAKAIPDIVKGSSNGFDSAEDVEDVQRLVGEISTVGIKRKDGTYVVPSANDVMRFVRSSEGGWLRDAKRSENIKADLEQWVNSPQAMEMAKQGEVSQVFRDTERVKQKLRDAANPPKK